VNGVDQNNRNHVVVVGGGLAGLSCAVALAPRGFRVTVLESRQRLGGRAGSFTDPVSGQLVDACQHVSMGCCTNFAHFCKTVGIDRFLAPQPKLYFLTPDRLRSVFKADPWPAPFHLGRALLGAHYLTPCEKLRIIWGMQALVRESPDVDPPLRDWLLAHRQTERTIERFWGLVLVSALNETVDRLGLKYARKVFCDGFLRHRDGFVVHVPTVPLGRFYGEELRNWLTQHGVELRENASVRQVHFDTSMVSHLTLRDGSVIGADWYVLAVPFDRVNDLLPDELVEREPYFGNLRNLSPSPIASVHLWFDRPVVSLPHAVLVDCMGQWIFNRGEVAPGEYYLQVVVSAAQALKGLGREEVQQQIVAELARVFPDCKAARLIRTRVVTEHAATFRAVPGVDHWRPQQASPVVNLALAGDYTSTGWPATMEGAVRSGYLAAEVILKRMGRPERLLQSELRGEGS
jgi:squalene-associated FAD-dependent desaturase